MLRLMTHALARLLPPGLRRDHGLEIARDIDRRFASGRSLSTLLDVAASVVHERRRDAYGHPTPFWSFRLMTTLAQDVRFAIRTLRRGPWFTAAVVLILGLGIGSTTAIVSLARATLLRPVAVPEPDRLFEIAGSMSYTGFRALQEASDVAEAVFAFSSQSAAGLTRGGDTRRIPATIASANFFEGLRLRPVAGRLLTAADDMPGGVPAVVISERLWTSAYDRSPAVIGEHVHVNRQPAVIVGVAPASFKGLSLANVSDIWMPAAYAPSMATGFVARPAALGPGMTWLRVVARLKPGVTPAQASARFTAIDQAGRRSRPDGEPLTLVPVTSAVITEDARADLRTFLILLSSVAGALLLLGCSNVANLLLARGAARRQELAVRAALGAGRGRLVSQLLAESVVLAAAGGAVGAAVAWALLRGAGEYRLPGGVAIGDLGLGIDATTLAICAALAVLAALVFGPLPAWLSVRRDVKPALTVSGRGHTRLPMGRALVGLQVAICVALVGGGLIFARGLQHALSIDLGYDPTGVAMTTANPALERLKQPEIDRYLDATFERLRADPSVIAAGASILRPMRGGLSTSIYIDGHPPVPEGEEPHVAANLVSEGWFEAMGLRLVKGRTFRMEDRTATPRRAVVSESAARAFWPDRDPIGARFRFDNRPEGAPYEVIGVVADARYGAVDAKVQPFAYISLFDPGLSTFRSELHYFVRTSGDAYAMLGRIRTAAQDANPAVPLSFQMSMEDHVASVLMPQRLGLVLLVLFASAGLVLSAAGVYAIAAYQVSMRQREIGIRMALGAARLRVVKDVVRDGMVPIACGLAAGIAVQLWGAKFAEGFVYGLDVRAPLLVGGAAAIVIGAAFAALLLPARRAASVDPVVALRN